MKLATGYAYYRTPYRTSSGGLCIAATNAAGIAFKSLCGQGVPPYPTSLRGRDRICPACRRLYVEQTERERLQREGRLDAGGRLVF